MGFTERLGQFDLEGAVVADLGFGFWVRVRGLAIIKVGGWGSGVWGLGLKFYGVGFGVGTLKSMRNPSVVSIVSFNASPIDPMAALWFRL